MENRFEKLYIQYGKRYWQIIFQIIYIQYGKKMWKIFLKNYIYNVAKRYGKSSENHTDNYRQLQMWIKWIKCG